MSLLAIQLQMSHVKTRNVTRLLFVCPSGYAQSSEKANVSLEYRLCLILFRGIRDHIKQLLPKNVLNGVRQTGQKIV